MRKVVVTENISWDGVMQAPAMPEEDTRGGFTRGGWAKAYVDQDMIDYMTSGGDQEGCLLLGRLTYQTMAANWPHMPADNPFTERINAMPNDEAEWLLSLLRDREAETSPLDVLWDLADDIARHAPEEDLARMPQDLAENPDRYQYGHGVPRA